MSRWNQRKPQDAIQHPNVKVVMYYNRVERDWAVESGQTQVKILVLLFLKLHDVEQGN